MLSYLPLGTRLPPSVLVASSSLVGNRAQHGDTLTDRMTSGATALYNMGMIPNSIERRSGQADVPQSVMNSNAPHHPIAEFLYQLTKMLTDDNSDIIEWSQGRIKVHDPERLANEVLHKYFRHSKYASFQRQLNYFGFRKIAGKGKMSPCSYVNDGATDDLRSILTIKRKTNGSASRKAAQRSMEEQEEKISASRSLNVNNASLASANLATANFASANLATANFASANLATANLASLAEARQHVDHTTHDQKVKELAKEIAKGEAQIKEAKGSQVRALAELLPNGVLFPENAALHTGLLQQIRAQQPVLSERLYFPSDTTLAALANNEALNSLNKAQASKSGSQVGAPAGSNTSDAGMPCPATAAMNAAAATSSTTNPFDSTPQLRSLLQEHASLVPRTQGPLPSRHSFQRNLSGNLQSRSSALLTGLPSSSTIFPDNFSSVSLRDYARNSSVTSLLGLGAGSRETSLVDLAMLQQAQLTQGSYTALAGLGLEQAHSQDSVNRTRHPFLS